MTHNPDNSDNNAHVVNPDSVPPLPPAHPATSPQGRPAVLPFGMEAYAPGPQRPASPRRNYALFTAAGLLVGLGSGLLLAKIDISAEPAKSSSLSEAVRGCGLTEQEGIDLGDEDQSLTMDSESYKAIYQEGADDAQIGCVLRALHMPDSVKSRMDNTRALDGRQSAEWDEFAASWSYHPDNGTNVVIEIVPPSSE